MSIVDVVTLIDNPLSYPEGKRYAAILGANPSKGARSPILWNAAFQAHGVDARMLALDVSADRLEPLLQTLEADPLFFGGAIAMPHKEAVARWLNDRVTPETQAIGAVNCLFRDDAGKLKGTNTDGEAALKSFEGTFGSLQGKAVLLLGPGGAGRAVSAFFQEAVGSAGRLFIAGRSTAAKEFVQSIGAYWVDWARRADQLPRVDVLVNCTSLGSGACASESPLTKGQMAALSNHAVVFDVIYQPTPTTLLSIAFARGLQVLDGTAMNLEQAVLAYGYAVPKCHGDGLTRATMETAKRQLG